MATVLDAIIALVPGAVFNTHSTDDQQIDVHLARMEELNRPHMTIGDRVIEWLPDENSSPMPTEAEVLAKLAELEAQGPGDEA